MVNFEVNVGFQAWERREKNLIKSLMHKTIVPLYHPEFSHLNDSIHGKNKALHGEGRDLASGAGAMV